MLITRIETQKKNPARKNIYVDGNFLVGVSDEALMQSGFRSGDSLSAEQMQSLERLEELHNAKQIAYRYLSLRPRTEKEIRTKLKEKEFAEDDISAAVVELKASGLIDDAQFARMYLRSAIQRRPSGSVLLKQKLLVLGLDRNIIDDALQEICTTDTQRNQALQAAQKFLEKSGQHKLKNDDLKLRAKLAQFLARRGFPWDIIQPVLKATIHPNTYSTNE